MKMMLHNYKKSDPFVQYVCLFFFLEKVNSSLELVYNLGGDKHDQHGYILVPGVCWDQ
jgi:hypothetical protein